MSSSSISRQVAVDMKTKKLERRDAIEKRNKPEDDKLQHQEIKIGGVSAETSSSDSAINSGETKVVSKPKTKAKKSSGAKKGGSSKKVLSDSKATKI